MWMLFLCLPLNSNLILLIRTFMLNDDPNDTTLNSNLILLILRLVRIYWIYTDNFKFQSDSINTEKRADQTGKPYTLNSNLILLIHKIRIGEWDWWYIFKFQSDSINTQTRRYYHGCPVAFKFQSDSINTRTSKL